jgi:hypothetical protein
MGSRKNESLIGTLMHTLTGPAVRDLAWAIGSPTLLNPDDSAFSGQVLDDGFFAARLAEAEPWLRELDRNPEPLHAFIEARHSHRLGHYFENLIEFWLRHAGVSDLRARLQVGEAGHAVGEFDFVFRQDVWGGWQHWEAAVKFYLQEAPIAEWQHFIGPNPSDRLSDKLHQLFDKQLMLGKTPAGRGALGTDDTPAPRAFVKGYLFFPAGVERPSVPGLSANGLCGWWLRHGTAPLPTHHGSPRWKLLHRLAWLAPARATADDVKTMFDTAHMNTIVERHFTRAPTTSRAPLLLAELAPGPEGVWNEIARGFVVSAQWPQEGPLTPAP